MVTLALAVTDQLNSARGRAGVVRYRPHHEDGRDRAGAATGL